MSVPVIFINPPRETYRDIIIAPGELVSEVQHVPSPASVIQRPYTRMAGPYDVAALTRTMNPDPSIVMCQWCCCDTSIPTNLAGIKCPKVLLVGDTHHTPRPLTRAIQLALSQPWDLVVLEFNQHHLKWFHEAGVFNAVYIPCLTISPIDIPPPAKRTRGVVFAGNVGPDHVYRRKIMAALECAGVKIEYVQGTREQCAKAYNEAMVSLNISLNGDFNLRNYESDAAGGCCITDCVGVHPDIGAWIQKIRMFDNESSSLAAGKIAYDHYWSTNSPAHKIAHLNSQLDFSCFFGVRQDVPKAPPASFWQRLSIYEQVQELVMRGAISPADFDGLPRWAIK